MTDTPVLSVVLVTPHRYDSLRKTMHHLRAQTIHDQIEVVLVAPADADFGFDDRERAGFLAVQVVADAGAALGAAKATGVAAASAAVVAFAEDHCYPAPHWAAALVAAHAGPWAAVGPAIGNANPYSMVSWANILIAYGHWLEASQSRVIADVPGHNSSYKRDLLLAYGSGLAHMLGREGALHADLQAQGHQLYLETAAKAYHVNPTRPRAWITLRFNAGRLFAATRAQAGWSQGKRLAYIAGAPLIPLMRLPQLLGFVRASGRQHELLPQLLPILLVALIIHSAGEVAGYALGAGATRERLANFEFDRLRQVTKRDRVLLSST